MTLGFRKNGSELKHVVGGRWQKEQQQQQKNRELKKLQFTLSYTQASCHGTW